MKNYPACNKLLQLLQLNKNLISLHAFVASADFFSKATFFQKILSETLSERPMVQILIKTDILSIWLQTVCKGYQQTTKVSARIESYIIVGIIIILFSCLRKRIYFINGIGWGKGEAPKILSQNLVYMYSKTCVKRQFKNRQNKDLNDKWSWSILQYF